MGFVGPERQGSANPRLSIKPSFDHSKGDEAIDIAELAGLHLDPWQKYVLRNALGVRPDGRWAAFQVAMIVSRQNGKGSVLEALELAALFRWGETLILHSAHEYRTAMEAFIRVVNLVDNSPILSRRVKRVVRRGGEEAIELTSGARLRFIARSKNAGRGFSAQRLIWDEAYALTEEQVDAQMPTLSAQMNAQIWYASSPPLDVLSGAQLFRVRRAALSSDPGAMAYFDWGIEGSGDRLDLVDIDDRELWVASNPALGHRVSFDAIERERESMSKAGFARERLGLWPPDLTHGFPVIPKADWFGAQDDDSFIDGDRVFAIDASWDRTSASIGVAGKRKDGKHHVEVVDTRPGTAWLVDRVVGLVQRWKPIGLIIDPGGPAGSLIPDFEAAGVEVTKLTTSEVARAWGCFYDAVSGEDLAGRTLRHIGQQDLTGAVSAATRRNVGDGFMWERKNAVSDITQLISVTNALYGFVLKGATKSAPAPWVAYA